MSEFAGFVAELAPSGLNLVGVIPVARWDAEAPPSRRSAEVAPGSRSIVVVGNGGPGLWRALGGEIQADPEVLSGEPHPVDAFARRHILAAGGVFDRWKPRWFWAAADATFHLDFRMLASMAGFGSIGRLGLVMHPRFGPWLGLRAACFVEASLPATRSAGPHPCEGCPAPCISACPGGAFASGEWSVDACTAFKGAGSTCESTCFARLACPAGAAERYDAEAILYHADRARGRAQLREKYGIKADRFDGVGPHWHDWRARVDLEAMARS